MPNYFMVGSTNIFNLDMGIVTSLEDLSALGLRIIDLIECDSFPSKTF